MTSEQLAKHAADDDAWMVLHGEVYNITAYLPFHPGGRDELLRAAGTDGTALFTKEHPWVNYQSMMKHCHVGTFVGFTPNRKRRSRARTAINSATDTSVYICFIYIKINHC